MTDTKNSDHLSEGRITDSEWDNRRLCPDGNCIGVIGPDGRCKECGRPAGNDLSPADDADSGSSTVHTEAPDALPADERAAESHDDADGDDWANRRLCPDGNCIGVIGPDGRCKECGRPDEKR